MKRILFVDDDPPVLEALALRLRRFQQKWEMTFVDSGARALAELQKSQFDVIVSDMRMPTLDGAELLRQVSETHPHIVRIVLSGYSDLRQTIRLVPVAHQYLAKPCEPAQLENTIERCFRLQELLSNPGLRQVVGGIRNLPSLPATFARLQQTLADERATAQDVARIVTTDPAICARVLQMVNSAFFRRSRPITSIDNAVSYLGFTAVKNIVMCAEVFTRWSASPRTSAIDPEQLQLHARQTAAIAQAFTTRTAIADDALLAALLHDIGYWILIQECPAELDQAIALANAECIPLHRAESRLLGATHAEIGAYLLGIWGLPYAIVEAVANHHNPERVTQTGLDVLGVLAVACELAPRYDLDAFSKTLAHDSIAGSAYLESLGAPFGWSEAERRAAECLAEEGAVP